MRCIHLIILNFKQNFGGSTKHHLGDRSPEILLLRLIIQPLLPLFTHLQNGYNDKCTSIGRISGRFNYLTLLKWLKFCVERYYRVYGITINKIQAADQASHDKEQASHFISPSIPEPLHHTFFSLKTNLILTEKAMHLKKLLNCWLKRETISFTFHPFKITLY